MSSDADPKTLAELSLEQQLLLWALGISKRTVAQALQDLREILQGWTKETFEKEPAPGLGSRFVPPASSAHIQLGPVAGSRQLQTLAEQQEPRALPVREQQRRQVAEEYRQLAVELGREPSVEDLVAVSPGLYTRIRQLFDGVRKLRQYLQTGRVRRPGKAARRGPRLTAGQRDEAARLYRIGEKVSVIAAQYDVSADAIYRILHQRGVEVGRSKGGTTAPSATP